MCFGIFLSAFLYLSVLVLLWHIDDDVHYYAAGERNLYALSEAGQLLFTKKFDFNPRCFLPYSGMWLSVIHILYGRLDKLGISAGN